MLVVSFEIRVYFSSPSSSVLFLVGVSIFAALSPQVQKNRMGGIRSTILKQNLIATLWLVRPYDEL